MTEDSKPNATRRVIRVSLLGIVLAALTGVFAGFMAEHRADGGGQLSTVAWVILAIIGVIALAILIQIGRDLHAIFANIEAMPKRERATTRMLTIAMVAGGAAGGATVLMNDTPGTVGLGVGSVNPIVAIIFALLLLTAAPWFTLRWWRAIDEHEQAAYTEGANIAGHFILIAGFAWWVLSRAALVPPPDAMVLIIAMCFVWTGAWFRRKYS
jgi:hypothetical protein